MIEVASQEKLYLACRLIRKYELDLVFGFSGCCQFWPA
jgi:hypothetical protein